MRTSANSRWSHGFIFVGVLAAATTVASAQDDGPSLLTEMIGRAESGETGPRNWEEAVADARRAVFRVQTYGPEGGQLITVSGGFIVRSDGLAITRASTFPEGGRALVQVQEDGMPIAVQDIVHVDRTTDLALIQLKLPDGAVAFPHIEVADEVSAHTPVWAVCFDGPRACRLDETAGPDGLPESAGQVEAQHWLAITGSLGSGAFEPIVDDKARLVGITTPVVDAATGTAFALAAGHVAHLMSRDGGSGSSDDSATTDLGEGPSWSRPPEPAASPGDASRPASSDSPRQASPAGDERSRSGVSAIAIPSLDMAQTLPAAAVQPVANRVRAYRKSRQPVRANVLVGVMDPLLARLAVADADDQALAALLADLAGDLDGLMKRADASLERAVAPICARRIQAAVGRSADDAEKAQPIVAIGPKVDPASVGVDPDAGTLVECGDHLLLIARPRIVPDSPIQIGEGVFAAGLFAGDIRSGDTSIAVVESGFIRLVPQR